MPSNIGQILWTDLTVPNAEEVRDFYASVIGWTFEELSMGDYSDFLMVAPDAPPEKTEDQKPRVSGICHARGGNADLPAQWLNYFGVADIDASRAKVEELGGKNLTDVKNYGKERYCVIEDPAGAVCALFEQTAD